MVLPTKNKKNRDSAGENTKIKGKAWYLLVGRFSAKLNATRIEKTSSTWLSAQKNLSAASHWRSASCRLMDEGGCCLMNIYVDVRFHLYNACIDTLIDL